MKRLNLASLLVLLISLASLLPACTGIELAPPPAEPEGSTSMPAAEPEETPPELEEGESPAEPASRDLKPAQTAWEWEWQTPVPQGNALKGVWGSSSSDVFAVGAGGAIVHYGGDCWTPMRSGITEDLEAVWGSSATDVFAAGWGASEEELNVRVSGAASSGDVFTERWGAEILHYDGESWRLMTEVCARWLYGIWGTSSTDVFAVGSDGTILHYDGTSWTSMNSGTVNDLEAVWGSSSSDVFAVGDRGTILHWGPRAGTPKSPSEHE